MLLVTLFLFLKLSYTQTCWGFDNTNAYVCSGHGWCDGPNSCTCNDGFMGYRCSHRGCYTKYVDDALICSGHGTCLFDGTCECNEGYMGLECETYTCAGFLPQQSGKCSGHGTCVSANLCDCDTGYHGPNCGFFECSNVDYMCKSILKRDRTISRTYDLTLTGFNPNLVFEYALYDTYPYRRPSEEVDCKSVFISGSYRAIGKGARCFWKSPKSHEFIVYFGPVYTIDGSTVLTVDLFPFEKGVSYGLEITPEVSLGSLNLIIEFFNGLMNVLPSWIKSPIYQVLGFFIQFWIWIVIGGSIFCIITFGSSFVSCFYCCDPKKAAHKRRVSKFRKLKEKIADIRKKKNDVSGARRVRRGGRPRSTSFNRSGGDAPWMNSVSAKKKKKRRNSIELDNFGYNKDMKIIWD